MGSSSRGSCTKIKKEAIGEWEPMNPAYPNPMYRWCGDDDASSSLAHARHALAQASAHVEGR
eukprot:gene959-556_t